MQSKGKGLRAWIRTERVLRRVIPPLYYWTAAFGFDPANVLRFVLAVKNLPRAIACYVRLRRQSREARAACKIRFSMPCLSDALEPSGSASGHYFHQDLFVARKVFERQPRKHVDVGSRTDGFVAHVAAYREIEVLDIRPAAASVRNISFRQCDVMRIGVEWHEYCDSLSCLHALEHFGLGRYGDTVDIRGHERGLSNLHAMLKPEGILYLSVPIGEDRVEFNAMRVLGISTVLGLTGGRFRLLSFSFVDDAGDFHEGIPLTPGDIRANCGCYYGCGIFELQKMDQRTSAGRPCSASRLGNGESFC